MEDKYFLDTNIIVYAFDNSETEKREKALSLIQYLFDNPFYYISTQVISEFCNICLKKMKPILSPKTIYEFISLIPQNKTHMVLSTDCLKALDIHSQLGLSYWDALIISSSLSLGCTKIFTEDMQHGQIIENTLEIINPFI